MSGGSKPGHTQIILLRVPGIKVFLAACVLGIAVYLTTLFYNQRCGLSLQNQHDNTVIQTPVRGSNLPYRVDAGTPKRPPLTSLNAPNNNDTDAHKEATKSNNPGSFTNGGIMLEKITLEDAKARYRPRTLDSCVNVCDEKKNHGMCKVTDKKVLDEYIRRPDSVYAPFMADNQYIYPYEKRLLDLPPLTDKLKLPDLAASTVTLANQREGEVACNIGQRLSGQVTLVDGYGKLRSGGLDEVRAWLVDPVTNARWVAQMTDLRDGRYTLDVMCLTAGLFKLFVSVPKPRQLKRATVRLSQQGVMRYMGGLFSKGWAKEVTICAATPNIWGRPCICNHTEHNGLPLYCGKPLDERLNCSDLVSARSMDLARPKLLTPLEIELINKRPGNARKFLVKHNITIRVKPEGTLAQVPPCYGLTPSVTWDVVSRPQGFFTSTNKTWDWHSLICSRPPLDISRAKKCLKDTSVWFIGDSNGLQTYQEMWKLLEAKPEPGYGAWPHRNLHTQSETNTWLTFYPHEQPFFHGSSWAKMDWNGSPSQIMDRIPSTGTHVVFVHYYLHFVVPHLSAALERARDIRVGITRLLARNPNVTVAVRGPHVLTHDWDLNHANGGDCLGVEYLKLLEEEFKPIRSKVIFIDGWEMTIADENQGIHPRRDIPRQMLRTMLAFKCP